jgi:hypothetical protein
LRKPVPPKTPPAPIKPESRWWTLVAAGAVAVFLLGLFSGEIFDPDFWWHLKTGKYIVQHHRLPVPDPFSYTTAGAQPAYPGEEQTRHFNLTHEWLAETAMYLVYALAGFPGVVFARALLLTAACFLSGAIAARRTNSAWWGLAAALSAGSVAAAFATDRPTLVSFLFTMVFIALMEWRRSIWVLPLLALVWANCHGGFFLGWLVCGAYCAEALIRRAPDWRRLLIVSGAVFLVSGLNPNGFGIIPTIFRYRQSAMTSLNLEWLPPKLWADPYGFHLLLYACLPILAIAIKRVRPADWMLMAFFTYAALTAFRNEIYVGLFAPIVIAAYFPWKRSLAAPVRAAGLAVLMVAVGAAAARGPFFQFRAGEWRYPAGAVDFLRSHHITARLFNTYEKGGYLIWKGESVFVDGRSLSESVYQDYRTILLSEPRTPARSELLDRYGIGVIVMDSYGYQTGNLYPLALAMAYPDMADWKLVYEDPQSMVFLRNPPPDLPVLPPQRIADHLESECRLLIEHDPRYPGCARRLGFLVRLTNPARARRMFALYLEHDPNDAEARNAYDQLAGK